MFAKDTVPVVVIGPPVNPVPVATLVTPVLFTVMDPAPLMTDIPVPAVKFAATGAAAVEPMKNCPFVNAVPSTIDPPLETIILLLLSAVVLLVPPLATVTGAIKDMVPDEVMGPPVNPVPVLICVTVPVAPLAADVILPC